MQLARCWPAKQLQITIRPDTPLLIPSSASQPLTTGSYSLALTYSYLPRLKCSSLIVLNVIRDSKTFLLNDVKMFLVGNIKMFFQPASGTFLNPATGKALLSICGSFNCDSY
jgi:hypothetical protein